MMKSIIAIVTALVSISNAATDCNVSSVMRPVFTHADHLNADTVAWCKKYNLECHFAIKVSSPDFDNTTAQVKFLRDFGRITRVGLVVDDITNFFAVNKTKPQEYSVIDSVAAKNTLKEMNLRLLGSNYTTEVSAQGASSPFMILPEITYMNYYGNAQSYAPYRSVYETIDNSTAFKFNLVPIGRDDFVRFTAASYEVYLSNWLIRDSSQAIPYNLGFAVDDLGNPNVNYTALKISNNNFIKSRQEQNITDFETLAVMESSMKQIYINLNGTCPDSNPAIQNLIDGKVIGDENNTIPTPDDDYPINAGSSASSTIFFTLSAAVAAIVL